MLRRCLVIASQCQSLRPIEPIDGVARRLHATLVDPERGACAGVSCETAGADDPPGLLLGQLRCEDVRAALSGAIREAGEEGSTLVLAWIGHGLKVNNRLQPDHLWLPWDGQPDEELGVPVIEVLDKALKRQGNRLPAGLLLLVDACEAGGLATDVFAQLQQHLQGRLRVEILTASAQGDAYNACFSATLAQVLEDGRPQLAQDHFRTEDLKPLIDRACRQQVAARAAYDGGGPAHAPLFVARNVGRTLQPWAELAETRAMVDIKTQIYQPTAQFQRLRERLAAGALEAPLALVGVAGSGKSTLLAALASERACGIQALYFIVNGAQSATDLGRTLGPQLRRCAEFQAAIEAVEARLGTQAFRQLGPFEREVLEPLRELQCLRVRFAIDGLDNLEAESDLAAALDRLVAQPGVELLVSARPDTPLPAGATIEDVQLADSEDIEQLSASMGVRAGLHERIAEAAQGNWLVASTLIKVCADDDGKGDEFVSALPRGHLAVQDAMELQVDTVGARPGTPMRALLDILAAAGEGPVLPIALLCGAARALGIPHDDANVRGGLAQLRGLVARSAAGTADERAGLFHQALVEQLMQTAADPLQGHRAILSAIDAADEEAAGQRTAAWYYAFARHADHAEAIGQLDSIVRILRSRVSERPKWNLAVWRGRLPRLTALLSAEHPDVLAARHSIAHWTGQSGDARGALELFKMLLPDQQRVLGADDPDVLTTRSNIASWTGESGDARGAIDLFEKLLPDRQRVLGSDHRDVLVTRNNIAAWTVDCGDVQRALDLFEKLLPDQQRVLGAGHPDLKHTYAWIAHLRQQIP